MYELELENKFNDDQLKLFQIMKENPNESLSSIADLYAYKENKSISKSGIYHWLKKLEKTVMKKIGNFSMFFPIFLTSVLN
nr:helix-turn-helix domain-containing protein [Mycoplasmopsis bovis]